MTGSPYGKMTIVRNSRSGRAKALSLVQRHLEDRGLDYEIVDTKRPGHAIEIARTAIESGSRFLVAMGGDGTIHEVLNGMIENDEAVNPEAVIGVVSTGTGCDFIKTFGIPSTASHAVAHLDGPESFPIDAGKITFERNGAHEVRYFANIAEVGLGAKAVAHAARLPRALGPLVYFVAFWVAMARHRPADVIVDLVDKRYEGKMNNLVVANGQYFGGGMKVAPKAAPTDGLLDIQVEHAAKREVIALMPKVYKGEHVPHPDILEAKRVRVTIESDVPLPVEADGELLGTTPAHFEILRDAIRLKV